MTAVKIGQVWRDKDKRRNTVIEIIDLGQDGGPTVQGLIVGTEEERWYDRERLVKRWELVSEKSTSTIVEADRNGNLVEVDYELIERPDGSGEVRKVASRSLSDAVEAVRDRGALLKVITDDKEEVVEVPQRQRPKQPVYQLKLVSPHNPDYKLRMTQKMIDDYGYPTDPWGSRMELAD